MTAGTLELDSSLALVVDDERAQPAASTSVAAAVVRRRAARHDLLAHDDLLRLRGAAVGGAVLAVVTLAVVQLIGGDPFARALHSAGLAFGLAACLWVLADVRTVDDQHEWHTLALGHVGALATLSAFYFWGPFTAVTIAVPAAAFVLQPARRVRGWWTVCVTYLAGHALLVSLLAAGSIDDRGFTALGAHSTAAHLGRLTMVQLLMFGSFAVSARVRRGRRDTVRDLDAALHALAQREALLHELDVERADAAHVDAPGRCTGEVFGSYRLGLVIGRGGHGVVYDAVHVESGEPAAIKLLHPEILADPAQRTRFVREVRTAAALRSPHVARVLELADGEGDVRVPYLAMERLRGRSLSDYLLAQSALPLDEVVELVIQIGHGLQAAHRAGIVHRDLKPRNVFRLDPPVRGVRWKVLDFGTSKRVADQDGALTDCGHVVGTPAYMAPEQAGGHALDYRVDIHALGALAYRALTGQVPYAARDIPQLLREIVYGAPMRPSTLRTLPADVDRVLAIALAKRPYERFSDAEAFGEALAAAASDRLPEPLRRHADRLLADRPWSSHAPRPRLRTR